MGDRVSISFKKGDEEGVALFSHWDGMSFVKMAEKYAKDLAEQSKGNEIEPLDRLEPGTVMLDFIRHLLKSTGIQKVQSNYYLGRDANDGDNSDNGHYIIDLDELKARELE